LHFYGFKDMGLEELVLDYAIVEKKCFVVANLTVRPPIIDFLFSVTCLNFSKSIKVFLVT